MFAVETGHIAKNTGECKSILIICFTSSVKSLSCEHTRFHHTHKTTTCFRVLNVLANGHLVRAVALAVDVDVEIS